MLLSVEEVIDAVGGTTAAAELAGVSLPAVSNWKARGKIPTELYLVFRARLRASPDPSIFGFAPTEGAAQ